MPSLLLRGIYRQENFVDKFLLYLFNWAAAYIASIWIVIRLRRSHLIADHWFYIYTYAPRTLVAFSLGNQYITLVTKSQAKYKLHIDLTIFFLYAVQNIQYFLSSISSSHFSTPLPFFLYSQVQSRKLWRIAKICSPFD